MPTRQNSYVRPDDPTEAELEQTIAEESANLPDWWDNSEALAKQERDYRPGIRIVHVRLVGGRHGTRREKFLW